MTMPRRIFTAITRRSVTAAAVASLALPAIGTRRASAQGRSLSIGTYNGSVAQYVREKIVPAFEADYGCRVYQTEGFTLSQIALLRQQKANPTYGVMMMDDTGIPIAQAENLTEMLDPVRIPNLKTVLPLYTRSDSYGVPFSVSICSPFVNTATQQPIRSYAELWDNKFRGRLLMVSPQQGASVMLLIVAAALVTGKSLAQAQYLIDQGYDKLAALKPNIMAVYDNHVTAILQVAQGEADIGAIDYSKDIASYTAKGAAVEQCFPREGVFGGLNCMTLVKHAPDRVLAEAFINRMLDPGVQKGLAEAMFAAPTVRNIDLDPKLAARMAYPEQRIQELNVCMVDWDFINPRRSEIIERLNRILGS